MSYRKDPFQRKSHPLVSLDGRKLGKYLLGIELKPLSKYRQGWTHFSIYLEKKKAGGTYKNKRTAETDNRKLLLEGIHSNGGRGVKGWIEVGDYFPLIDFKNDQGKTKACDLEKEGLDRQLFRLLADLVTPGGHVMFAYEVIYDSSFHKKTMLSLAKRIPPACTAQGHLLFQSGLRYIKNWYLAEGGYEGPCKLWGEKSLDIHDRSRMDARTFFELLTYLSRTPAHEDLALELEARKRGLLVLGDLRVAPKLSSLQSKIIKIYQNASSEELIRKAARETCRLIQRSSRRSHVDHLSENCIEAFKKG